MAVVAQEIGLIFPLACRENVKIRFDIKHMVDEYEQLFESLKNK